MDLDAFEKQLAAADEFEVTDNGITLRLRDPTEIQIRAAAAAATPGLVAEQATRLAVMVANMQPQIVRGALIGWSGVKASHLLSGGSDDPVPFDKRFVDRVLSRWTDLYDKAYQEIQARYDRRRAAIEEEEKNS